MHISVIDLFLTLVQIDSPTGEEEHVREYIRTYLHALGIPSEIDIHGNLLARIPGEGDPLLLSAHMDTVEPGRGIKPAIQDDGMIVSDGTTILGGDNKIGIAIILALLSAMPEQHRPLELLFTVSEESGFSGASKFDYTKLTSKEGYCFDLTQPLGRIVTAAPYYEHFEITVTGKAAHASRPHLGKNVVPATAKLLSSLTYGKTDDTYLNIGLIQIGEAINTVPGKALCIGEIRTCTKAELEKTISTCKEICASISQEFTVSITSTWVTENPGYRHVSAVAKQLIARTEHCMHMVGLIPVQEEVMGLSDANEFNAHGICVLELSTGGENAHALDERVSTQSLEKLLALTYTLIQSGK